MEGDGADVGGRGGQAGPSLRGAAGAAMQAGAPSFQPGGGGGGGGQQQQQPPLSTKKGKGAKLWVSAWEMGYGWGDGRGRARAR